jgi:hypothetical protein
MGSGRARSLLAAAAGPTAAVPLPLALTGACGDAGEEPSPRPFGEATGLPGSVAPPREQARVIATSPRLLLFDLQTALEGVRETRGSYPTEDEFGATESWALQRAALDEAFDSWSYESDGGTYRLTGASAGRELAIESPR